MHIDEDCKAVTGEHDNGLFFNCKFDNLNGLTLRNCDLNQSQFVTTDIRKAMGFTVTMNCFSFGGVELSPQLFDLYLLLLCQTRGNDEKREQLLDIIGRDKAERLLSIMKRSE